MLVRGEEQAERYRDGGTGSREGKQGGSILGLETDGRVNKDDWTVGFVEKNGGPRGFPNHFRRFARASDSAQRASGGHCPGSPTR